MENSPQIKAYILCWNEEKMIRHTLNHYSAFCSRITIIDNCSTDSTLDIIKNEYPHVFVKQYDSNEQIRDDAYIHIKNTIWKNASEDWVIVCDMDELLYHPNISAALEIAKQNGVGIITTEGYNMYSKTFPEDYSQQITDQVRIGVRATHFDKSIIFSPQIIEEINFAPGAHSCSPVYKPGFKKTATLQPILLLHYKYLGVDYLIDKHSQYAARLSNYNKSYNFGGEYLKGKQHVLDCFDALDKCKQLKVVL